MYKKGFTLIEMSIILVIIGLLTAITVKGKILIEKSRYRKEIGIIRTVNAVTASYIQYTGEKMSLTKESGGQDLFSMNDLLEYSGMMLNSFKSEFKDKNGKNFYYIPALVAYGVNGDYTEVKPTVTNDVFVLYSSESHSPFRSAEVSVDFYCNLEILMDDRDAFDGRIRLYKAEQISSNSMIDYDNCPVNKKYSGEDFAVAVEY